jgi:hypothetical protein
MSEELYVFGVSVAGTLFNVRVAQHLLRPITARILRHLWQPANTSTITGLLMHSYNIGLIVVSVLGDWMLGSMFFLLLEPWSNRIQDVILNLVWRNRDRIRIAAARRRLEVQVEALLGVHIQ